MALADAGILSHFSTCRAPVLFNFNYRRALRCCVDVRLMRVREFHSEQWLPLPIEQVFPFFADAGNLKQLTPPWLHFRILTPRPIEMRPGTLIDYRLRVRGLPLRWQSEITAWEPPHRFVDEQRRGPYCLWQHEHTFEPRDGGTMCGDHVRYAVPFDALMHRLFVRPDIERIFAFRREKLECLAQNRSSPMAA